MILGLDREIQETYWFKCCCCVRSRRGVVNCKTTICVTNSIVYHLRHTFISAIACSEVNARRPVVGQILSETTRGAGS